MELWHILILIHIIFISTAEGIGKYFVDRIDPIQVSFFQYLTSVIWMPILYFGILGNRPTLNSFPWWYIAVGSIFGCAIWNFWKAKQQSLTKSILMEKAANGLSILIVVLFFGEYILLDPTTSQGIQNIAGLTCIALAVILLYSKKTHANSESSFNYALWIPAITTFVIVTGAVNAFTKPLVGIYDPLQLLTLQYIGSFSTITILMILQKKTPFIGRKNIAGTLVTGFFTSTAVAAMFTALTLTSGTQFFAIKSIGIPALTILIGVFFFKETFNKRMWAPFICAVIGILLLS